MKRFDEWYGPYPYAQITVVDPPHGAMEAGGMEYPTFITGDTVWWAPKGQKLLPEGVTEHEFGHQYWYGMVATNEFENAWLDEGINSYTEVKVVDSLYGKNTSLLNWMGAQMGDAAEQRGSYIGVAETDSLSQPSYRGHEHGIAMAESLTARPRRMLLTLEAVVGEQDAAEGAARLLHEVPVHPSDAGRLPAHGERSRRTGPGLVLAAGGVRNAGARLQGPAGRIGPGRLGQQGRSG